MNLNKVVLIGRISTNINVTESKTGFSFVRFNLAITRDNFSNDREEITDFVPLVAFRNNATFISKFFNKGDLVSIVGSIQSSQYTTKSGEIANSITVVIDQIKSLEPRSITQARMERNNTTIANNSQTQNNSDATFYSENKNEKSNSNDGGSSNNGDNPWELDF